MLRARRLPDAYPLFGINAEVMARLEAGMRVSDRAAKCTVFLGRGTRRGFEPLSTGFLVGRRFQDVAFQYIVTAQHCVVSGQQRKIRVNKTDGSAAVFNLPSDKWYFHPDPNRYVDVAVMPVSMPYDIFDISVVDLAYESAIPEIIKARDIGIGDEVFFPGLFLHHAGHGRNLPVVRSGILSAMDNEPIITKKYGSIRAYLVEARSIGGHSGSPVFVNMEAPRRYPTEKPRRLLMPGTVISPYYLLGLMRSHLLSKDSGEYITDDPKTEDLWINSGIATVVPVDDIITVIEQPELEELRMQGLKAEREGSVDVPTSIRPRLRTEKPTKEVSELPTTEGDEQHRERFTATLASAARKRPRGG